VKDLRVSASEIFKEENYSVDSTVLGQGTLAEALRRNTAIFVRSYGGSGVATLSLRGTSSSHTNVYWNNLEVGSPMLGVTDLSTIPIQAADDFKVQYGFASLSDGSGGIGGSVRINNSFESLQKEHLALDFFGGSFGRLQGSGRVNLVGKKLGAQIGVLRFTAENNFEYPDISKPDTPLRRMQNAEFDQSALWALLYYRFSRFEQLSLKTSLTQTERELPASLTGNTDVFDNMRDSRLMSVLDYQRFGDKSHFVISTGMVMDQNDFQNGSDSSNNKNQFVSWQNSMRFRYNFSDKLRMESGMRFKTDAASSPAYNETVTQTRTSLFTDWHYLLTDYLEFSLLLREELVNDYWSPILGAVGARVLISKEQTLRFHAARNYRYPGLNDLFWTPGGNQDLKPETSYNFEAGYHIEVSGWPSLNLSLFHNIIDDWIQWQPNNAIWTPQNIRKVANTGMELKLSEVYELGDFNLSWRIDYAYTRSVTIATYTGSPENENNQLPFIPEHLFAGGIELHYDRFYLRLRQQFTGSYFTNADNSIYMPYYNLTDINFGIEDLIENSQHKLSLNLELNNIFNYPYQVLPYRPEPGFNAGVRISYCFVK
jgi:vitamin B12 transporter